MNSDPTLEAPCESSELQLVVPPDFFGALEAAQESLKSSGQPKDLVRAVILVGTRRGQVLRHLVEALPALELALVLETDPQEAVAVRARLALALWPQNRQLEAMVECPSGDDQDYSIDAYVTVARFLLAHNIALDQVLVHVDVDGPQRAPRTNAPLQNTLEDLFWRQSRRLLDQLGPVDKESFPFFQRWARYLLDQGQAFHALKFFFRLLDLLPPEEVAQEVVACLVHASCAGELAKEWIDRLPWTEPERLALREDLQRAIDDNAQSEQATLEANLEALAQSDPALVEQIRAVPRPQIPAAQIDRIPWRLSLSDWELSTESYPVFFTAIGSRVRELNSPRDPRRVFGTVTLEDYRRECPAVLIGNLLQFDTLANLASSVIQSPLPHFNQPFYVVEESLERLAIVLRFVNLCPLLTDERIKWFLGPGAVERLAELFDKNSRLALPKIRVGLAPTLVAKLALVEGKRQRKYEQDLESFSTLFPKDYPFQVLETLEGRSNEPLRILFGTSLFSTVVQHVTRDLSEAMKSLGVETATFIERSGFERFSAQWFAEAIAEFRPHALFVIDHLRSEYGPAVPKNIPWLCWIQDQLPQLSDPANLGRLGPLDFNYAVYSRWVGEYQARDMRRLEHLPFAVNTAVYCPSEQPVHPRDEVAYLTNLGVSGPFFPAHPGLDGQLLALLQERGIGNVDPAFYRGLVDDACAALGRRLTAAQARSIAEEIPATLERWYERRLVLRWLVDANIPVALYGNGWDRDPEFAHLARGTVSAGPQLAEIYRNSKVVLHVNQCLNAHPRVFECLAAGGFVLARRTPYDILPGEIHSCLEPDKELQMFSDRDELLEKVRRAFSDAAWRNARIEAGQRRVLAEQSYQVRARQLLVSLRRHLSRLRAENLS